MMDYAVVIADLEAKRGALDQILAGFRTLTGEHPEPARAAKQLRAANGAHHEPKPHPAPKPSGNGKHGKLNIEALLRAKVWFEQGLTEKEIGEKLGVSGQAIHSRAKTLGWHRDPKKAKVHLTDPGYQP